MGGQVQEDITKAKGVKQRQIPSHSEYTASVCCTVYFPLLPAIGSNQTARTHHTNQFEHIQANRIVKACAPH